jgi:hypothetical protein
VIKGKGGNMKNEKLERTINIEFLTFGGPEGD